MKSKTSCFNLTILKKNFTHYWPLWSAWLAYLLIQIPIELWLYMNSGFDYNYYSRLQPEQRAIEAMGDALRDGMSPVPVFFASVLVALAVFSYLYTPRTANMMHALPLNRLELYTTNYLSGLLFLVLPEIVTFLAAVLVCVSSQITCIQYLLWWFLGMVGITFFAYSLAVFVAMFTGQIFAMPVYYFVVNFLYVGCLHIVNQIISMITYGIVEEWKPGVSCILSPLYYINNNVRARLVYENETATSITVTGMHLVAIYAAVAVIITVAAYRLYRKRKIECAGDLVSIGIVKPIFRWGVALCGGVLISCVVAETISDYLNVDVYPCLFLSVLVFGFLCFFAAEMLLQKGFKVFKKARLIEWGAFTVVAVVFISLFEVDAFGIARRMPEIDEIEAAFVNMDYPIQVETDEIPELLRLHQMAIDNKEFYKKNSRGEKGYYYTTITYFMKDGTKLKRRYPLPVGEDCVPDMTEPAEKIMSWETRTENLKRQMFGRDYENNEYRQGHFDRYDGAGNMDNYALKPEERDALLAALNKDVDAGNFDSYFLPDFSENGREEYMNGITFDYYNKNGIYDNWEYYDSYGGKREDDAIAIEMADYSRTVYISVGPKCTYTIACLEKLGIVDDTWKLMTYDEYDEMLNHKEAAVK